MSIIATKNLPVLEVLKLLSPESSINTLRSWLQKERVLVDGVPVKDPRKEVIAGQKISLRPRVQFLSHGIEVLYEDRDLVVVVKPEGLLSVATDYQKTHTLHDLLKRRPHIDRVYPVHRLDRETSGILVFAYTEKARDGLKDQFEVHSVQREYLALVEGVIASDSETWKSHLWEDPLYKVHSGRGKLAITHYTVVERRKTTTLLRLRLETGRKNQIRVHCSEAGHPIVGDLKYGAKSNPLGRLALHAEKLGFTHPLNHKPLQFQKTINFN